MAKQIAEAVIPPEETPSSEETGTPEVVPLSNEAAPTHHVCADDFMPKG